MRTSTDGRVALAASEGVVPAVYRDSVGVDTFGVGVTAMAIGEEDFAELPVGMPADVDAMVAEALKLFSRVLVTFERVIKRSVVVPLFQHEFDALVHFAYNVGGPNFRRSKLLKNLNAGDYEKAGRSGFHGWLKPIELRGRRDFESNLFLTGDYGEKAVPVYRTNGAKRLGGRLKAIPYLEALEMITRSGAGSVGALPQAPTYSKGRTDIRESSTIKAQQRQWIAAAVGAAPTVWAAFQQQDVIVQAAMIGAVGLSGAVIVWTGRHIINERLNKWLKGIR